MGGHFTEEKLAPILERSITLEMVKMNFITNFFIFYFTLFRCAQVPDAPMQIMYESQCHFLNKKTYHGAPCYLCIRVFQKMNNTHASFEYSIEC